MPKKGSKKAAKATPSKKQEEEPVVEEEPKAEGRKRGRAAEAEPEDEPPSTKAKTDAADTVEQEEKDAAEKAAAETAAAETAAAETAAAEAAAAAVEEAQRKEEEVRKAEEEKAAGEKAAAEQAAAAQAAAEGAAAVAVQAAVDKAAADKAAAEKAAAESAPAPAAEAPTATADTAEGDAPAPMNPAVASAMQEAIAQAQAAAAAAGAAAGEAVPAEAPAAAAGDPPKKKSRWGSKEEDPAVAPVKKSRWGSKEEAVPGAASGGGNAVMHLNPEQVRVQQRLNEIQRLMAQPSLDHAEIPERFDPDTSDWISVPNGRSPSPPPVYDRMGKRSNTRDMRLRDGLQKERLALVEKLMSLQPNAPNLAQFKFGGGAGKQRSKIENKIFVPVKEHPGYPFIGLILGPRGNTQKKLERETGAKIVIRGKGSVKSGSKSFRGDIIGEDEDLHVSVSGDSQEQVDAASKVIRELLTVKDDNENEWKRMQLRELAMINGTMRDDQDFFKDEMRQLARTQPGGNASGASEAAPWRLNSDLQEEQMHRDMQRRDMATGQGGMPGMDSEYSDFMADIGGKPGQRPNAMQTGAYGMRPGEGPGGGPPRGGAAGYGGPPPQGDMGPYGPRGGMGGGGGGGGGGMGGGGGGGGFGGGGGHQDVDPECNLYVSGLPAQMESAQLRDMFARYGEIQTCSVIKDKMTGMSRQFGFVAFRDHHAAQGAIQQLNNTPIEGKTLQVRLKGAPAERLPQQGGGGGGGGGGAPWRLPPQQPQGGGGGYGPPQGAPGPYGGGPPRGAPPQQHHAPPPWGAPPQGGPGGPPPWGGSPQHGGAPPQHGGPPPGHYGGAPPQPYGQPPQHQGYPPQQQHQGYPPQQQQHPDPYAQHAPAHYAPPPQHAPPHQGGGGPAPLDNEYAAFMSETGH